MERNDQLMQEWKQEMKQLKLPQERIANIEAAIEKQPKKRWTPVQIVMPFAAAIVLLLVFAGMPQMGETTTSSENATFIIQPLNGSLIGWAIAANLFAVVNYCLMIAVVQTVPRVGHVAMFEAFKNRMNKRQIWQLVLVVIFFAAFGWAMVLLLPFGLIAVQMYMGILYIPFVVFIQLLMTRNNEWPVCGHCGEIVTGKTMRKRNWGKTPTCHNCNKQLYEDGKARTKASRINFFAPFIIITPQLAGSINMYVLFYYIFIYLILLFITMKYIAPYTVEFTDDDKIPPLW